MKEKTEAAPVGTVLLRTGGLGDAVLALPLLAAARALGEPVRVWGRAAHWPLWQAAGVAPAEWLAADGPALAALLAEAEASPPAAAWASLGPPPARVWSYWPDADGQLGRALHRWGVPTLRLLPARPTDATGHAVEHAATAAGVTLPAGWRTAAPLGHLRPPPTTRPPERPRLWVHLGAGSPAKVPPTPWLRATARAWLAAHPAGELLLGLGETEAAPPRATALLTPWTGLPATAVIAPTLKELLPTLAQRATAYLGGDTGPSHLAAALGLPCTVAFTGATRPALWAPLGPAVTVAELRE